MRCDKYAGLNALGIEKKIQIFQDGWEDIDLEDYFIVECRNIKDIEEGRTYLL